MACIFCDQTPETENAVEALAAIKQVLSVSPETTPEELRDAVERMLHREIAKDGVIKNERERRQHAEAQVERYAAELRHLQETMAEQVMRATNPPTFRGPSSSPGRIGRGDFWRHEAECPMYVEKPNGKHQMFGLPYGHKSKKDRTK